MGGRLKTSMTSASSPTEKAGVHQIPVNQSGYQTNSKHYQSDDLFPGSGGLSSPLGKYQEIDSAYSHDGAKRRQFHRVTAFL